MSTEEQIAEGVRKRLMAYSFGVKRAIYLRSLMESLKAGTALTAGSIESQQDGFALDIPADVAMPIIQAQLDQVEKTLADFKSAAGPLISIGTP